MPIETRVDASQPEADVQHHADNSDARIDAEKEGGVGAGSNAEDKKKKKKRKRKPKAQKGTGFEEYYADPPITPQEAEHERSELYHPNKPFSARIIQCIQRFRARRRLDSDRSNLFNKYLFLGGVDTSQRQFGGVAQDKDTLEEADSEMIRTLTAIDSIGGGDLRYYPGPESEDWEVDFEAVVKGFLSRTMTDMWGIDKRLIDTAAELVKNFLNYVLMHDVCPEHADNILKAHHICEIAPAEFDRVQNVTRALPDSVNEAARKLFCEGRAQIMNHDDQKLVSDLRQAMVLCHTGNQSKVRDPSSIKIIYTGEKTYEVIGILRPRKKNIELVEATVKPKCPDFKAMRVGLLLVKPAMIPHAFGNKLRPDQVNLGSKQEVFMIEDEILINLTKGMKIQMTVCETNADFNFIKEVHEVRVSFDTLLAQSLMVGWKDPVVNTREAPSVHNPDAEEKAFNDEARVDD
ncbi:Argonaute siRNA chaperone complex subunit Arb1-domain-containing protein [Xylariaceae sp. FL1019]|nr:Argonaute siRNA chaperone complex subunit Arb1-domain-containing protein [Xylariaceae sp. FL1019]